MSKEIIEIDAKALALNIEKVAEDVLDDLLRRAQELELAKRSVVNDNGGTNVVSINGRASIEGQHQIHKLVASMGFEPINKLEAKSLHALLAYVADNQNVRMDEVRSAIAAEFGVNRVEELQRINYMQAIEFLVDLRMDELN